jgi:hypothetical protein
VYHSTKTGVKKMKSISIFSHSNPVQSYLCIAEKKSTEYPIYECGIDESLGLVVILPLKKINSVGNQTLLSHSMGSIGHVGFTPSKQMTLPPL